ncbi:MAG TPA: PAS domain S-box protein [Terracidiphilus sp.]|nr:PAS domain S-box protein [Terracidiphilus sp.]
MQEGANAGKTNPSEQAAPAVRGGISLLWPALAGLSLALAAGAVAARVAAGPRFDGLLIFAAGAAGVVLALRLLIRENAPPQAPESPAPEPLRDLFESSGPGVVGIGLDGSLTYVNPSAERMLGYHAEELMKEWATYDILGPGEGARLVAEMERLCGVQRPPAATPAGRMAAYMECVRNLPPSRVPAFDAQLRRKDGELIPSTLHISAVRDTTGAIAGLMAVAVDQGATMRQEMAQRESQERYRDLFENSSEMIATLSPAGKFLYANPAWKRCFGKDISELIEINSIDELFGSSCRTEVAALFRRALDGELVDRAPLRHHTPDGRILELELSLSQRQKAGNPLAIRCLMRDVTQQKQREHRLALQLVVSQILGENASSDVAVMRILEALCVSQGWDMAVKWGVNAEENRLEFRSAWAAAGRRAETFIQESMGLTLAKGVDLPGRAWQDGRPVWFYDLASMPATARVESALRHEMVSGWAVPVREGNKVLAVLEFYCHFGLREDREALAAVETVAASLGQMLARSEERGRAEELYRQQEILLDSVTDGICGVDRRGLISFANPAAASLLRADAATLAGTPVHDLLHGAAPPNRQCSEECPLRRAQGRQKAAAGEDTIFRADGSFFPAEYVLTPIADQGRFSGSVLSFRDISQRYALDRLKDEFISTVSHELRTPLTSIRGALGLLSSGILGDVNDKATNLLRIAVTNSDRLVRLINDILDLERIQSGKEPLAFRPVQLAQIVRQAIDGMAPVADAAGVQLIHDTTQVEIAADPDRLLQVLTNLLSNAVKFSPPSSTISVMMRPGASGVTLSVIDQGRGIPADKLEAIFGRFQQVDASDSRQKGGSGLGLAICRTIVHQHSGRIWAERNPVRGSTFRVFLPYERPAIEAPKAVFDHETGHGTVLLAGANPASRPHIAILLTSHGYRVVETTTVEETLAAAHDGVEAILLDTSLDGMNGWEILPLLRRLRPDGRIPIVLLSVDKRQAPVALPADAEGWVANRLSEDVLLGELARVFCGPGESARILVVEDDVDLAHVIRDVFTLESIEVHLAHSLQEALDACFSFQPHLLVLDIGLPDGDGFNVVDWLRKHENLSRLPLVVYSGRDLSPNECRELTLGPTQFLTKARVQPQQLLALVLTMLRNSRQMEEAAQPEPSLNTP